MMLLREKIRTVVGSGHKRWQSSRDTDDRTAEALALWWRDVRDALIATVDGRSSAPADAKAIAEVLGDETATEDGIEALNAACEDFADWFANQSRFAWRHAKTEVDERNWPLSNPRRQGYVDCLDEMQRRASADSAMSERRIPLECLLDAVAIDWRYLPSPGAWRTRTQPMRRERISRQYLPVVEPLLADRKYRRPRVPACRMVNIVKPAGDPDFTPPRMPIYDVYDRDDMTTPRLRNATSSQVNWSDENSYVLLVGTRAIAKPASVEAEAV